MDSTQQKINYLYDREKKREFDECVEVEKDMFMAENGSAFPDMAESLRISFLFLKENREDIIKKCKIKVYGK